MAKPKTFRPWVPEQTLRLPPSPVDWLPADHLVPQRMRAGPARAIVTHFESSLHCAWTNEGGTSISMKLTLQFTPLTSFGTHREMNSIAKGKQQRRLPDFIVIGATKAGTTSLDFYLSLHPEIQMARPKEPRFFIDAPEPAGRWQRGLDWYRSLFVSDKTLCGEVSPAYTHAPALPGVPERMARIVPEARLIYLVREPFERLQSHFLMQCRQKGENFGLADFLAANPDACCLLASEYGSQLQGYLNWFPRGQILVVESEQLARNRVNTLRRIFEFLGVDVGFSSPLFHHRRNVTGHQGIPNEMGQRLLHSRVMTLAKTSLPDSVFYHLRNLALTPFTKEPPR